jgi:hypothetical protein
MPDYRQNAGSGASGRAGSRFAASARAGLATLAAMRGPAFLVVFVVGCVTRSEWVDEPGPGSGPGSNPGDGRGNGCAVDSCGANAVCARNHTCLPLDQVRTVHADWTLRGTPASLQSCAAAKDLLIAFFASTGSGSRLSYAPVPCVEGRFTIDKLPKTYDRVELGLESGMGTQHATIDATGQAQLDLPY